MKKTTNILLIFGLVIFIGFLIASITDASVYLQQLRGRYYGPNNPVYNSNTTQFTKNSIIIGGVGGVGAGVVGGVGGGGTGVWYCIVPDAVPVNNPPSATNLNKTDCDWCVNPFQFILNWTFTDPDGDSQAAKQIQLDNNSNFSSIDHDSGKVENNVQAYTTFMTDGRGGVLQFNKSYYWRLKVWDSRGAESSWIIAHWIVAPQTLNTPRHAYPDPNFTWQPLRPIAGDSVQFTDQSIASGGARIVRWSWTFQDGNPPTSFSQNPLVIFGGGEGAKKVQLTVWDTDNYSCPVEKEVNIGIFAPIWREIAPW